MPQLQKPAEKPVNVDSVSVYGIAGANLHRIIKKRKSSKFVSRHTKKRQKSFLGPVFGKILVTGASMISQRIIAPLTSDALNPCSIALADAPEKSALTLNSAADTFERIVLLHSFCDCSKLYKL